MLAQRTEGPVVGGDVPAARVLFDACAWAALGTRERSRWHVAYDDHTGVVALVATIHGDPGEVAKRRERLCAAVGAISEERNA